MCKFVSKHQEALCAALDGRNKDVAVEELAIRFQQTYLAMLTRIQINNTGALLISRDVDTYIDLFKVSSSCDGVVIFACFGAREVGRNAWSQSSSPPGC